MSTPSAIRQPVSSLFARSGALWVLFVPVAIANGILRESTYGPHMSELLAHQVSTIIASSAFLALAYYMLREKVRRYETGQLLAAGGLLVTMTIGFEFGFGHYVDHKSWSWLMSDYNIFRGHIWPFFLLAELASPLLVQHVKKGR